MRWHHLVLAVLCALPFANKGIAAEELEHHDVVILGGGPGALTSALYLARLGVQPIVIEGNLPGGLISQSHLVQNWPGELEISGAELIEKLKVQAKDNGAVILPEEIVEADFSARPYTLTVRNVTYPERIRKISTTSLIIAMGTKPNHLGVEGENAHWGKGVTNCAVCDGPLYRGKVVAIVGGGASAILEADYLSEIASKVHIFVRSNKFRTLDEKRKEEILSLPNIEVHYLSTVQKIEKDDENIMHLIVNEKNEEKRFEVDGVFLAIGSTPNTKIFKKDLELDARGYIVLKKGQETSIPGVYAIGDIVDPVYKQAISAAGDGAKAAIEAHKDLLHLEREAIAKGIGKKSKTLYDKVPFLKNASNKAAKEQGGKKETAIAALDPDVPSKGKSKPAQQHFVREITSVQEFDQIVRESNMPVIADFYASWCVPCKNLAPLLEEKASAMGEQYLFLKINVDTLAELAQMHRIRSMPTVLYFEGGKEATRKIGKDDIARFLQDLERNSALDASSTR